MNTHITTAPSAVQHADLLLDMRERRKELGLTLEAIAAALGKSPIWVGAVFSGQGRLTPETAVRLAEVLSVDESSLEPLAAAFAIDGEIDRARFAAAALPEATL
jgi:transcriptional regulator with XRE-family HTH domain